MAERTGRMALVGVLSLSEAGSLVGWRGGMASWLIVVGEERAAATVSGMRLGDAVGVIAALLLVERVLATLATLIPLVVRSLCCLLDAAALGVTDLATDALTPLVFAVDKAVIVGLAIFDGGDSAALALAMVDMAPFGVGLERAAEKDVEDAEAQDVDLCPLATEVLAAFRLSTAARMWMERSPRSSSSRISFLAGEAVVPVGDAAGAEDMMLEQLESTAPPSDEL